MSYEYFVIVDSQGHAGLAATVRSTVETDPSLKNGSKMFHVQAQNAFQARRAATAQWTEAGGKPLH